MAQTRRVCRKPHSSISLSPSSPRQSKTIVDTPRRTRLLCDAKATAGKLPRTKLFKRHGVPDRTGYRILKEGTTRRSERIHNRGRKPVLLPHQREAIETVENSTFRNGASTHYANASLLGLANGTERSIQKNMADYGVGTFMAQQKKYIKSTSVERRQIWGFDRRYWKLSNFQQYRYCDECHFATGLQRQARVHRRHGTEARNDPKKIQFKVKRSNQIFHVFGVIGWNYKSKLHFYTGSGVGGRLIQEDYIQILKDVVAPDWDVDCILLEDNDQPHGTRGNSDNKVKQTKAQLGIKWEANPPDSPDLNPIESIWRMIKQRLKNRGVIFDANELRRAIEEEWNNLTLEEINKAIATMPARRDAVMERNGLPTQF